MCAGYAQEALYRGRAVFTSGRCGGIVGSVKGNGLTRARNGRYSLEESTATSDLRESCLKEMFEGLIGGDRWRILSLKKEQTEQQADSV